MEQKFITGKGIELFYLEKNPDAEKTIFFIHGNSGSSNSWNGQLSDKRFKNYRLIAIDLPAHGNSGADEKLRYGVMDLAAIMVKVIDNLSTGKPYLLVGFSMGVNLIGEMLAYTIKPVGLVFIGASLIGDAFNLGNIFLSDLNTSLLFSEDAAEDELKDFFTKALHNEKTTAVSNMVNDYKKVKPFFRTTLINRGMEGHISNEFELVRQYNVPVLIMFGKNEKIVKPFYLDNADLPKWQNTVFKIDDAGHFLHVDQPQQVNSLILEYAEDIFKDARA